MKNILYVFAFTLVLSACKKEIQELPPATQTGANTFGLKADGKFWVPQRFAGINSPVLEAYYSALGDLRIKAMDLSSEPTETEFVIYIKNATGTGVYQLNQSTDIYPNAAASYAYHVKRRLHPLNEWITGPQHTGTLTLTKLDLENRIVSGTFEFTAGSMDSSASAISVTEGRFDIRLQ